MNYHYANDDDITARDLLDQEERALDAVLAKIEEVMASLGDERPYSVVLLGD